MDDKTIQITYWRLIAQHKGLDLAEAESKWRLLAAAHIVGQSKFKLHLHSHAAMLRLALRTGNWREAQGQAFRLLLVPLGHAVRRLPAGNTGRATVSAFRPMTVSSELRNLIESAKAAAVKP
jgi:hypothetical protein